MAAQKLQLWPTGAAAAADWGCYLLPFWVFFFFFCFSAFLMLEVLFKEETWSLLEPPSGTTPCHPCCVQGSTNNSCCSPCLRVGTTGTKEGG